MGHFFGGGENRERWLSESPILQRVGKQFVCGKQYSWEYSAPVRMGRDFVKAKGWEDELERRLNPEARIITSPAEKRLYSRDIGEVPLWFEKNLFQTLPDLVVQPASSSDVAEVVKFAWEKGVAIVPRGTAFWGFGGVGSSCLLK